MLLKLSWSDNHLKALPEPNRGASRKKGQVKTIAFYSKAKEQAAAHETWVQKNETKYHQLLYLRP